MPVPTYLHRPPPNSHSSTQALLPPPSPLPSHPSTTRTEATGLSTAATAFALRSYLETFLLAIGWDPCALSPSAFITQYSWLLGEELGLPPATAASLFLEIFEATTPTMRGVAMAIVGMQEKLGCDVDAAAAVKRLWTRNQGMRPEVQLREWDDGEEGGDVKVAVGVVQQRRKRVGGWWSVFRVAMGKVWKRKEDDMAVGAEKGMR